MNNGTYYKEENKSCFFLKSFFFLNLIILESTGGFFNIAEDRSPTRSNTVASEFSKLKQSRRKVALSK